MASIFSRHFLRPISPFSSSLFSHSAISSFHQPSENPSFPHKILQALLKHPNISHFSQIHALLITSGYIQKPFFAAKILNLSPKLGDLNCTLKIFNNLVFVNRVCVNAVIRAYSDSSVAIEGVVFYFRMIKVGFFANSFTFPPLLRCCVRSGCVVAGRKCHGQAVKKGVDGVVEIQNCLIHMYGGFGLIDVATQVFDEMAERDLVSWNSMIGGLFRVGDVESAHNLFDGMSVRNVVSWNVVMAGYLENDKPGFVLKLFRMMQKAGFVGDSRSVVSVLTACGRSGRLKEGMSVFGFLVRRIWDLNLIIQTATIDMYSKCGKVEAARRIFDGLSDRNLVCWNSMILGHCLHGNPQHGLELFEEMVDGMEERPGVGVTPDAVTFVGVLCACTRASLLEIGRDYFHRMAHKFFIKPNFAHYWCMANLLACKGLTQEALETVRKVDAFNGDLSSESVVWASLLGLCRFQGHVAPGERVAKSLIQLEPQNIMCYALLFNIYAAAGRWDDVHTLKETIRRAFAGRTVGCSLTDLIEIVHEFTLQKSSKDAAGKVVSVDELFQRQDLSCLLPPVHHS